MGVSSSPKSSSGFSHPSHGPSTMPVTRRNKMDGNLTRQASRMVGFRLGLDGSVDATFGYAAFSV
jgi:hypothetical protein